MHMVKWKPQVTEFGDGAFKEAIKVKCGHKGRALIQYAWYLYNRKRPRDRLAGQTDAR